MTTSSRLRTRFLTLFAVVGGGLAGCSSCVDAGFCKIAPDEPTVSARHPGTGLEIRPGETRRIQLELYRPDGSDLPISPEQTFVFGTSQPAARAEGGNTLYLWADEQVRVSWDGVPFTKDNVFVTIAATEEAKPPGADSNEGFIATPANYAYVKATDAKTIRVGPLNIFFEIAE